MKVCELKTIWLNMLSSLGYSNAGAIYSILRPALSTVATVTSAPSQLVARREARPCCERVTLFED